MLQIKSETNLKSLAFFLTLIFYLPQAKRENIESVIQFFQRHNFNFERLKNKKGIFSALNNGNFIAHSRHMISWTDFEHVNDFLSTNIIVVALFYQNKIWTLSRLQKLKSANPFLPRSIKYFPNLEIQLHVLKKNLQQIWL